MSPEFKVDIVVPYTYIVDAGDKDEAEKKALEKFEQDLDDWNHPAVVKSIEEITADGARRNPPSGEV